MKTILTILLSLATIFAAEAKKSPAPFRVGTSMSAFKGLKNLNYDHFKEAKEAGLDCIEMSLGQFLNGKLTDEQIRETLQQIQLDAQAAGIEIWSVHMPFGQEIDLSHTNEAIRSKTVDLQKKMIEYCAILQPKIVLFHPSWYLGLNEREARIAQLIRSVEELNPLVRKIGATMVIENMLGYELLRSEKYERPLCRTVEETVQIMNRMPKTVYAAVDMNHIDNPELLIEALGSRVRTVHVSDGDGRNECHYLPCNGKGDNDWNKILGALYQARYKGPFMYEVKASDIDSIEELVSCYRTLYENYLVAEGLK